MNETTERTELTETSPELAEAVASTLGPIFGHETLLVEPLHTGGGCMVLAVDLSQDGRFMGRQLWLTRDGANEWLLGAYDYAADDEDEGICVTIRGFWNDRSRPFDADDPTGFTSNEPYWVAAQVAAIIERLGATRLQGS